LELLEKERLETLESDIREFGHKEAIKVSKKFRSLLGLEKPINNINSLFRKYDQDNEIFTEQNNPIVAIREKAESLNKEFRGMMLSAEDEYRKFCDYGTHDIAHEIGEIEPDDYFRISKHLEAQMIHAIEVTKANKELSQHIEKLEKQNMGSR